MARKRIPTAHDEPRQRGASGDDHNPQKIDEALRELYAAKRKAQADVKRKGLTYQTVGRHGVKMTRPNPAVKMLVDIDRRIQSWLRLQAKSQGVPGGRRAKAQIGPAPRPIMPALATSPPERGSPIAPPGTRQSRNPNARYLPDGRRCDTDRFFDSDEDY
jgi:hypothetical protein